MVLFGQASLMWGGCELEGALFGFETIHPLDRLAPVAPASAASRSSPPPQPPNRCGCRRPCDGLTSLALPSPHRPNGQRPTVNCGLAHPFLLGHASAVLGSTHHEKTSETKQRSRDTCPDATAANASPRFPPPPHVLGISDRLKNCSLDHQITLVFPQIFRGLLAAACGRREGVILIYRS